MKHHGKLGALMPFLLSLLMLAVFLVAFSNFHEGQRDEGRRQLEDAVRRATVACYAAEGIYPPSVAYLEEHYGIQIDHERYAVMYDVFASNLMPDITVLELTP